MNIIIMSYGLYTLENDFLPYIQEIDVHVFWELHREEFGEFLSTLKYSGVGPDGIPYYAWAHGEDK